MKIFCIAVLSPGNPANIIAVEHELSTFGYFQKSSAQEFMNFTSKTLVERTRVGQRQGLEQDNYLLNAYVAPNNIAGVVITDKEYPQRVSYSLISKVLEDFTAKVPPSQWTVSASASAVPNSTKFPELKEYLNKYQDPNKADSIAKVQKELDETKIVLHKTINSVLERGEKLDDLVAKSDQLSTASKTFYKTAQKTNSCCRLM
ncbi:YKT6 v-SNARE protein-like protein [Paraphysoderma sedebokerense]|nr:YKT6 v-SNARE protein-like protein [Paraphysoderma sedebokerense]